MIQPPPSKGRVRTGCVSGSDLPGVGGGVPGKEAASELLDGTGCQAVTAPGQAYREDSTPAQSLLLLPLPLLHVPKPHPFSNDTHTLHILFEIKAGTRHPGSLLMVPLNPWSLSFFSH